MNARTFLLQSLVIRESLQYISERIEKLEADLGYHPLQLDDSGASKATVDDKVGDKLAEIADLETEWKEKRIHLEKKNEEIKYLVEKRIMVVRLEALVMKRERIYMRLKLHLRNYLII